MTAGLTVERLRSLLDYDTETGHFRWRISLHGRGGAVKVGARAGTIDSKGKRQIKIDRQVYFAHRLAFLWMTGEWPTDEVDHKNGRPDDNAWPNLRQATASLNAINRRYANRKELLPVGCYRLPSGRYSSSIQIEGRLRYLGSFDTPDEAHNAFIEAAAHRAGSEFIRR